MKIVHVVDSQKYSELTVHAAIKGICQQVGIARVPIGVDDEFYRDEAKDIVCIVEAEVLKATQLGNVVNLRMCYPNAKIVILGSDSVWFHSRGESYLRGTQYVDLWLDLIDDVVDDYTSKGIRADSWMWTVSQYLVDNLSVRKSCRLDDKDNDFICLMTMRLNRGWRYDLVYHLRKNRFSMIREGVSYDLQDIHTAYARSRLCLGTTSPAWIDIRSMKGFRDWVAPLCGTVLIYDDHPDVVRKYHTCPRYSYDALASIDSVYFSLMESEKKYNDTLNKQITWIKENTIDKQFLRLFEKYEIFT